MGDGEGRRASAPHLLPAGAGSPASPLTAGPGRPSPRPGGHPPAAEAPAPGDPPSRQAPPPPSCPAQQPADVPGSGRSHSVASRHAPQSTARATPVGRPPPWPRPASATTGQPTGSTRCTPSRPPPTSGSSPPATAGSPARLAPPAHDRLRTCSASGTIPTSQCVCRWSQCPVAVLRPGGGKVGDHPLCGPEAGDADGTRSASVSHGEAGYPGAAGCSLFGRGGGLRVVDSFAHRGSKTSGRSVPCVLSDIVIDSVRG